MPLPLAGGFDFYRPEHSGGKPSATYSSDVWSALSGSDAMEGAAPLPRVLPRARHGAPTARRGAPTHESFSRGARWTVLLLGPARP